MTASGDSSLTPGQLESRLADLLVDVDLIVFDCDGVLVDSEWVGVAVEQRLLAAAGFEISKEEICERFVGLTYSDMLRTLERETGRQVPPGLRQDIETAILRAFETELAAVAGIPELLASTNLDRCVASSSDLERIEASLRIAGLDAFFLTEHLFSAEMVERGKPAPDLFLHAAACMQVDPSRCLVLEDSPHGVRAGVAAGMKTVGFTGGRHARPSLAARLRDAGASAVVDHASALLAQNERG
jgi:HAD superfamily hydrolase (TIGR01509 family)